MKKIKFIQHIAMLFVFLVVTFLYFQPYQHPFLERKSAENPKKTMLSSEVTFLKNEQNAEDSVATSFEFLYNPDVLIPFYEKLYLLDSLKDRKINILHIGDSHIQADAMTQVVRERLQEQFGNAGLGFVFPYTVINTNGGKNVRFSSNIKWESKKNGETKNRNTLGLSGYSFETTHKNFVLELQVKNKEYAFNTLKIITPENQHLFDLALNKGDEVKLKPSVPKSISHKVKKGETLYAIAKKYNTSVAKIQQINKLKGTNIRIGSSLKIGTEQITPQSVSLQNFDILKQTNALFSYYTYENLEVSEKVFLTPSLPNSAFSLNGILLENNKNGVIYHGIGVNGAHFSDFNHNTLFFKQIKAVEPELIVISLGTNEAFSRMSSDVFLERATTFIQSVREHYGNCPILLTTPPPSMLGKKKENPFPEQYANILISNAFKNNIAVFDLFNAMGGNQSMSRLVSSNLIAHDRVHYSSKGYQEQGALFYQALIDYYLRTKKRLRIKPLNIS